MTLENEPTGAGDGASSTTDETPAQRPAGRRAASRPAGPPQGGSDEGVAAAPDPAAADAPAKSAEAAKAPAKKTARKRATKKAAEPASALEGSAADSSAEAGTETRPPAKKAARKRVSKKAAAAADSVAATSAAPERASAPTTPEVRPAAAGASLLFQAPDLSESEAPRRRRAASRPAGEPKHADAQPAEGKQPGAMPTGTEQGGAEQTIAEQTGSDRSAPQKKKAPARGRRRSGKGGDGDGSSGDAQAAGDAQAEDHETDEGAGSSDEQDEEQGDGKRRRRRRGGRGRRKRSGDEGDGESSDDAAGASEEDTDSEGDSDEGDGDSPSSRRRRRRRRRGGGGGDGDDGPGADDPPNTVVRVRQPRKAEDEVTGLKGSTRLEAKRQRRREGRDTGRRKPIVTEAEFLARRESVERIMVVREREGRTQIGVLEDGVLVEHYVARKAQASMVGNVYLGKVQNVLPSMEAAFVDIGKGRNAVLYAGEVNWDAAGMQGQPRRIELALKSGDPVLVQVTKDPIGNKGSRLTSQVSLAGRYLVYVPNGSMTGISRKLPDTERTRLKKILKAVVPDEAGVIVRTASEGASETELERDVARLQAQWDDIEKKSKAVSAPALLHGEPDLTVRVIRDVFNEDFTKLVVSGDEAWDTVQEYVGYVAPDLADRLERYEGDKDVFAAHRIDEQIAKAVERKVWLPSGGSLVIDRTEAMTVVDVNTGKFVGSGGNLEATVTKNNIEAAEEVVRQLRLRDVGGIIVIDFIDMVLESNRDLVMRRLLECLGRDRTKHQVAEVTSLGLVQMTRKRVGQGLLDAFSEPCETCGGRGVILHDEPVEIQAGGGSGGGAEPAPQRKGRAEPAPERKGKGEVARIAEATRRADAKAAAKAEQDVPATVEQSSSAKQEAETATQEPVIEEAATPKGEEPVAAPDAEVATPPKRRGRRRAGSPVTTPKSADATAAAPEGA